MCFFFFFTFQVCFSYAHTKITLHAFLEQDRRTFFGFSFRLPFPLTRSPGDPSGRGGRGHGGRGLVVRRRRGGRQRFGRPGGDHFRLGRVHATVTAFRVLQRRIVIALPEKLGADRGLRRTLGPAAAAHTEAGRGGRSGSGHRVRRLFRRGHGVVLFPFRPPVLEPDLHLWRKKKRKTR